MERGIKTSADAKKETDWIREKFSKNLKTARKRLGYTIQDLSNFTGVSIARISIMENCEQGGKVVKNPSRFKTMCNILYDDGTLYALWFMITNNLHFEKENEDYAISQLKKLLSLQIDK